MDIADKNNWVMAGSVLKKMKKSTKDAPKGVLKKTGLKNCHSYTVIDVREIMLDNNELEYLVFLRNPTGNFYLKESEVWNGDWSPLSDKWTPKTRKQVNYHLTEMDMKRAKAKAIIEMQNSNGDASKKKKKKKKKRKNDEELDETMLTDESMDDLEGGEVGEE